MTNLDPIVRALREHGYISVDEAREQGVKLTAGTKLYAVNHKKAIAAFQLGRQPLEKGMNILGAHIDSPRLDVKQNPLYENENMAYLDTHYYGGIKKYHAAAGHPRRGRPQRRHRGRYLHR